MLWSKLVAVAFAYLANGVEELWPQATWEEASKSGTDAFLRIMPGLLRDGKVKGCRRNDVTEAAARHLTGL
jgi:hypothetical protein